MMKKFLFLVAALVVVSSSANAQSDHKKFEFWGTYSLLVADIDVLDNESLHGFGLGVQGNVNRWFGMVAEFTNNHGASGPVSFPTPPGAPPGFIVVQELDTRVNTFLFGPRLSYRTRPVTLFGHFLAGVANSKLEDEINGEVSESNTEFAMGIGGGIDVNLGDRFAIRAAQFDYLPIHTDFNQRFNGASSSWLHNTRFQAGVVFRF